MRNIKNDMKIKRPVMIAALVFCLFVGSLYPRLFLEHNLRLIDKYGQEVKQEGTIDPEIPLKIRFRIVELWNLQ